MYPILTGKLPVLLQFAKVKITKKYSGQKGGAYETHNGSLDTLPSGHPFTPSMSLAAGGTWTKKADMPTARYFLSASVVEGKIYVIGGGSGFDEFYATVEVYDAATDTWVTRADMPTPRGGGHQCRGRRHLCDWWRKQLVGYPNRGSL
ncbi:TPA: hypothetical protein EYP66_11600 [Candidatus Poribacteria bacterium]|nr:hypothetical protein [Candidatus Poribacteria bacterium]